MRQAPNADSAGGKVAQLLKRQYGQAHLTISRLQDEGPSRSSKRGPGSELEVSRVAVVRCARMNANAAAGPHVPRVKRLNLGIEGQNKSVAKTQRNIESAREQRNLF